MYFDINSKILSGKKYSKYKQTKYLGFVKLGVWWAERDRSSICQLLINDLLAMSKVALIAFH